MGGGVVGGRQWQPFVPIPPPPPFAQLSLTTKEVIKYLESNLLTMLTTLPTKLLELQTHSQSQDTRTSGCVCGTHAHTHIPPVGGGGLNLGMGHG